MPYFRPLNSSDYDFHPNMTWGEKVMHHMVSLANEQQIDLNNLWDIHYLGTLYFGTPSNQKAQVTFDTGSDWLTVKSDLCVSSCEKPIIYNHTKSSSAVPQGDGWMKLESFDQEYGSANLTGY